MRRLLLATAFVLLVAASTAAAAGHPLNGTFITLIAKAPDPHLEGIWEVDLLSTGHYTIKDNGLVVIRGRDTETATTISFGHETGVAACTGAVGPATYRWSLKKGLLRLTVVHEGCFGRHVVLTTHPLKKA